MGWLSVVGGSMENLLKGWGSMVTGPVLIWLVGWWSTFGGRWSIGGRWFGNMPYCRMYVPCA